MGMTARATTRWLGRPFTLLIALTLSGALALPGVARAAFPGRDGEIAFNYFSQRISPTNGDQQDQGLAAARIGRRSSDLRSCHATYAGEFGGSDSSSGDCSISYGKPAFSPDGSVIAFSTSAQIALMEPNGHNFRLLPRQTTADANPVFSPHGGRLLFEGGRSTGRSNLYVVNLDGSGLRQITERGASEPAWSSTGAITFVRDGQIYVTGGRRRLRRLTRLGGASPSWSPSGRSIAFIRNRDVYVMGADGSHLRRLTHHHVAEQSSVVFAPSGGRLAFGRYGINTSVEVIDLHGHRITAIDTPSDSFQSTALDWQPLH